MIDTEIAKLEKELKILRERQDKFEEKPIEIQVATQLHDILCTWNHTDGCGWFYHENNWEEYSHKHYLQKAMTVLDFCNIHNIKPQYVTHLISEMNK